MVYYLQTCGERIVYTFLEDVVGTRELRSEKVGYLQHHVHPLPLLLLYAYMEHTVCSTYNSKDITMSQLLFLLLVLVLCGCIWGYMTYRTNAERRAKEKRRNQYHDRV